MADRKKTLRASFRKAALTVASCAALLTAAAGFDAARDTAPDADRHGAVLTSCIVDFQAAQSLPPQAQWQDVQSQIPDGNGNAVLVIPGFAVNDAYMADFHSSLQEKGYIPYGWEQGINTGADAQTATGLAARLEEIYAAHGNTKVSLVGYSLGGVYARELARAYPDMVQNVITLGTPFAMDDRRIADIQALFRADVADSTTPATAPPVPTASLYSERDRMVRAKYSQHLPPTHAVDVDIFSGHLRMPFSDEAQTMTLCLLAKETQQPPKP